MTRIRGDTPLDPSSPRGSTKNPIVIKQIAVYGFKGDKLPHRSTSRSGSNLNGDIHRAKSAETASEPEVDSVAAVCSELKARDPEGDSVADSTAAVRGERKSRKKTTSRKGGKVVESKTSKRPQANNKPPSRVSSRTSSSASNSKGSRKPRKSIDITKLSKHHDPALEAELEDIAFTGRSAMISGAPSKTSYDVESGKGKRESSRVKPRNYVEDEADKAGHGLVMESIKPRKVERRLVVQIFLLICLVGLCIVVLFALVKKDKTGAQEALDVHQERIHNIISKITDPKILSDPSSPQFKARQWILFRVHSIETDHARIIQRYALACFYYATGGEIWAKGTNWLDGSECEDGAWNGLNCSPTGDIRALVFDDQGLDGTLPPEIGHLSKLESFILKNNPDLNGFLPSELGHMRKLRQLGLYNNDLSGVIPSDVFEHAHSLKYINLEGNKLWGSIPLTIQSLASLETLVLSHNKLEGVVPFDQLVSTNVKYLGLGHNRFSSVIERSVKNVQTLEYLYLDHNEMRGRIPDSLGFLTNLVSLDIGNNKFSGTLPTEVTNLNNLEFLSMNNNRFQGTLPLEIGSLSNLKTFNVATNQFTGTIPDVSNMSDLVNFMLFENEFSGTIPETIQHLQSLEVLFLSSNLLTGHIPAGIHHLGGTLRGLYLSDNQIEGSIPMHLCAFDALEALFLDTNQLTGKIPSCMGELVQLQQLYLFQNQLTGTIPSNLEELEQLSGLGLEQNNLVGAMPDNVCQLMDDFVLEDVWADCGMDQSSSGSDPSPPLSCSCCSVCCPSDQCT